MTLSEITLKYGFPLNKIKDIVRLRLNTIIQG